jgi:hypothetical protein
MVRLMIWHNKHLVSMLVTRISVSLSVLGVETGLTGNIVGLTGVPDDQTGLTVPANPNSPVLENLDSNGPEQDKASVIDWRRPIIDYL